MTTVYVVTISDCEATEIVSIHQTMEGALTAWNEARLSLIEGFRGMLDYCEKDNSFDGGEMYKRMICCLEETRPEKINNYPHEAPYITGYDLEE